MWRRSGGCVRHHRSQSQGNDEPYQDSEQPSSKKGRAQLGTQEAKRIAHDLSQLVFITGIHDRNALRIASVRRLAVVINATEHDYIAANARALTLNHRTADGRHVSVNRAFDNHVAAKSYRPFLN